MPPLQRVLLVDDHPVVRAGIAMSLDKVAGFSVCGEAGTAAQARELVAQLRPELIVLDLFLDRRDGLDLIRELLEVHPAARILVYSAQDEQTYARRALQAGARGYMMKTENFSALRRALQTLSTGERHVSKAVAARVLDTSLGGRDADEPLATLSDRELHVLRLIAAGKELAEMSRELKLSVKTIGTYRERLKNKLGIGTARELAREAERIMGENDAAAGR